MRLYPDAVERYKTHAQRCLVPFGTRNLTIAEAVARGYLVRVSEGIYRRAA
jgi:hypothetical protein